MCRLAIDHSYHGKRLSDLLLMDALARAQRINQEAGFVGLFVDALDERAAGFFLHSGFMGAPVNSLMLFLPVA